MFQAQNKETIISTSKVAVFFKIITTTSVTDRVLQHIRPARPRPRPIFLISDLIVLRPTASDHITGYLHNGIPIGSIAMAGS